MPNAPAPLERVIDLLLDVVCMVDVEDRFVYVSAASQHVFGYAPEELIGTSMIDLVHPEDRERTLAAAAQIMGGTPNPYFENRYLRKDGSVAYLMWSARWSEEDGLRIAVARDISERRRAEAIQSALLAISDAAHTAADLFELFHCIHGIVGGLLPARNFFVALHNHDNDMLEFPYFVDEHDMSPGTLPFESGTLSAEVIRTGKALLLTPDMPVELSERVVAIIGREPIDWLGVPLNGHDGVLGALVVQSYSGDTRYTHDHLQLLQFVSTQVATAIERKQTETRLRHIAEHDVLTHLPNRRLFDDRLQTAMARARRDDEQIAVLYVDLDHFKPINDQLGHAVGDRLLIEMARRLNACVRESDTVGRMGGDEFVVLLTGIEEPGDAGQVAEKIRNAIRQPLQLGRDLQSVSASIGIAVYPADAREASQLVREADHAMYSAKQSGGNRCVNAHDVSRSTPRAGGHPAAVLQR